MFRFPSDPVQRRLWVQAIKREKWQPNAYSRVCSDHFISGEFYELLLYLLYSRGVL